MAEQRMVAVARDCPVRRVPTGEAATLPAGEFVTLTQALGGNYTVLWRGNLWRVDAVDAPCLGLPGLELHFDDPGDGRIHEEQVWQALETIYDPEIPVNIRALGLVYRLEVDQERGRVTIDMTLTAPGCGMGPVLVGDVERRVGLVPNVKEVVVNLVFDPPWSRDRMSDEAKLETGLFF
ncbi:MAG: putative Fe-S cluster assembly protein SufT [Porticoccaceae bacterium]|nr:MAG: putative Fe-S cluster assembly protein SufT [Porticoccaceae bacterium]